MRGPTCIFWADLTPFSLEVAALAAAAAPGGVAVRHHNGGPVQVRVG